jgi:glycerol uptake facilitator-like aquaporin
VLVAVVTLALGLNKQVDIQAVMLPWGRALLRSHDHQSWVPVVLVMLGVALALAGVALLVVLLWLARPRRFRLALLAVGVLVTYSVLRTATITHLNDAPDLLSGRLLLLEGAGSSLLVFAAVRERRTQAVEASSRR